MFFTFLLLVFLFVLNNIFWFGNGKYKYNNLFINIKRIEYNIFLPNVDSLGFVRSFTTQFLSFDVETPLEFENNSYFSDNHSNDNTQFLSVCQPILFSFETTNSSIFENDTNAFPNCVFWNQVCV